MAVEITPKDNQQISGVARPASFIPSPELLWISDPTLSADPGGLIGAVLVEDGDSIEFASTSISGLTGSPRARPEITRSLFISNKDGVDMAFPGWGIQVGKDELYSVVETDLDRVRLDKRDGTYVERTEAWIADNPDLMANAAVSLYRVDGVVYKGIARKRYRKVENQADVGPFGVLANGEYFKSSEEYQLDCLFGLSLSTIKRAEDRGLIRETPDS